MLPHQSHSQPGRFPGAPIDTLGQQQQPEQQPAARGSRGRKRQREMSPGTKQRNREQSKKKKANRACFHCQKAHLTCDDSRPCQRCLKRGMGDSCVEGIRKKAKYLLDEEELAEIKKHKDVSRGHDEPESSGGGGIALDPYAHVNDPLHNLVLDTKHPFDSQAVNLEYSIMSAILGPAAQDNHTPQSQEPMWGVGAMSMPFASTPGSSSQLTGQDYSDPGSAPFNAAGFTPTFVSNNAATPFSTSASDSPIQLQQQQQQQARPQTPPPPALASVPQESPQGQGQGQGGKARQSAVYRSVTKAYDYREGFHFLMRHLKERYVKNDILRIIRAIAMLRPSLIALQVPLSEEDEVFVEKCFQRSVLELEKLVGFNGTPTVAWRRTGEIVVVGVEFSILTGWSKDELLGPGKRKFIYELFENQSAVEYWEQFASHAFENTTQSVHTHCVLLTRTGAPVLCAFCFSIRRDIFDLPNIVIGQWLPLLS
ncbi:hypothetical protein EXIGLDRAFT_661304 [Exidia glandulosa HHB12029]|uniref:Transcription activator of gluconeogenesis ERT1 n=1 Tax=Exidia glandulosa HHB12029 TaxID=1314781 RepID=A0A166NIU7_EXIGL|nr:hypothetical protein EXIGLDRAFT_661304 [Exidia glandulosa HHB12029]